MLQLRRMRWMPLGVNVVVVLKQNLCKNKSTCERINVCMCVGVCVNGAQIIMSEISELPLFVCRLALPLSLPQPLIDADYWQRAAKQNYKTTTPTTAMKIKTNAIDSKYQEYNKNNNKVAALTCNRNNKFVMWPFFLVVVVAVVFIFVHFQFTMCNLLFYHHLPHACTHCRLPQRSMCHACEMPNALPHKVLELIWR